METPHTTTRPSRVMGVTPFERPNPRLAVALARAGARAVLDLGRRPDLAAEALAVVQRRTDRPFGVRLPAGCDPADVALPSQVTTLVLAGPAQIPGPHHPVLAGRTLLVEVVDRHEARVAAAAGAHGLIARGAETGGRVGDTGAFVLLQQLLEDADAGRHGAGPCPVWVQGGIGEHTAAAAVAGGATGVVLDAQLSLVRESSEGVDALPDAVRRAVAAMDGSETVLLGGHRVFSRPDLPVAARAATEAVGATEPAEVAGELGAPAELTQGLLPVGQDGAMARHLAERHVTAGGVVQAVEAAIDAHLAAAVACRPLAPGHGVAGPLGLRYPIAQGPMTRVSDRAAFAAAVAAGGGLPFLALALLSGDETRRLLQETAEQLGDRPWGVGVLGFVPAEVRNAQLEAVQDIRPPAALIAGGRPSQAAPLEAAGIATFLHVPSPGLLDRFLKDGARRFVFEGRECGGHVGPRTSFALWESQVARLTTWVGDDDDRAAELQLLFAGGVHDERSAAMVAALTAPLARAGAQIGVLMGTAYLFTEEAVAGGAILPGFQQAALACDQTVLLETSPGHATRCADTDYVRHFRTEAARLRDEGVSAEARWAELEQLNLGRLRMASKGVRRDGDALVEISADEQRREGMVMIGEVASLRRHVTTVATLHDQVSRRGSDHLDRRADELGIVDAPSAVVVHERPAPLDVAIVGMAAMLPGAADTERYWADVVAGADRVTEVPVERWDPDRYYDPDAFTRDAGRRTPSKWGGFLPPIPFDALAYGIPPASLVAIEPVQLLALEVAARALVDAGYEPLAGRPADPAVPGAPAHRPFARHRASVIFGAEAGTDLASAYGFRSLAPSYLGDLPDELDEFLPRLTEDSFPGLLTNVIAGRIANRLDLGGVNYTVDAACAASLAALDLAAKELVAGTSDMVLCGGADLHNGINDFLLFASVHALSPSGRCRTFDQSADGIALGEGVACVVLKRLADAERDGDRIYAVLKAVAGSSDGRHLGLTAPRQEGQERALRRAYARAGVSPAEVGLVEAHGTGTVVGDRTELATLTEVFTDAGAAPASCTLGSVKSQIGHTKCAAGLAGLIKVARALHAGVRPPTLHLRQPNQAWTPGHSPFVFDDRARPWPADRRVAGVSAFGFGGTNFHAVLEAHDPDDAPMQGLEEWPCELFLFRGSDRSEAVGRVTELADLVAANDDAGRPWSLRDLARTSAERAGAGSSPVQAAVVATDLDDLTTRLTSLAGALQEPVGAELEDHAGGVFVADPAEQWGHDPGAVAFLFPGQGSQRPDLLSDLFVTFPTLQAHLRLAPDAARAMFPPASFTPEERRAHQAAVTDTAVAQPALGMGGLAVCDLLAALGIRPGKAAGHSYGELVALCAAGAFDARTLLDLSRARAQAMVAAAGADPGAMAAVRGPSAEVRAALGDAGDRVADVVVANENSPRQTVIAGPSDQVDAAVDALVAGGVAARRIPVACAFHSPVVASARRTFAEVLATAEVSTPSFAVWSNTTAEPYPTAAAADVRRLLADQLAEPVRFVAEIESMYESGARVFVEAGPGRVLSGLVADTLVDRPHVTVPVDVAGDHGVHRLLLALAELAVHGVPVDTGRLFAGRSARVVSRHDIPRRPGWLVDGHLVRTADGTCLPGGLRPASEAPTATWVGTGTGGVGPNDRDTTVLEYLRSVRELVSAERDVMLRYLGEDGPAPLSVPAATIDTTAAVLPSPGEHQSPDPAMTSSAGSAGEPLTAAQLLDAVLAIVSERTGYPLDMLDPDLDLEADLSIDSIKRIEILGELADRVGLPGADGDAIDESVVEELAQRKTLRSIVAWITDQAGEATSPDPGASDPAGPGGPVERTVPAGPVIDLTTEPEDRSLAGEDIGRDGIRGRHRSGGAERTATSSADDDDGRRPDVPDRAQRTVVEVVALPTPDRSGDDGGWLAGTHAVLADGGLEVTLELAELLEERGASVRILPAGTMPGAADVAEADVFVHLGALAADAPPDLPDLFLPVQAALIGGARAVMVATATEGRFGRRDGASLGEGMAAGRGQLADRSTLAGLGVRGLMRTAAREFPRTRVVAVDLDPKDAPENLAVHLLDELVADGGPVEVGYDGATRTTLRTRPAPLDPAHTTRDLAIDDASVVLLTGGARGITARLAVALARRTGCAVELVGRTPLPDAMEDPTLAGAHDRAALRRALIDAGERVPAQVEARCRQILAERELRATAAALDEAGSAWRYHAVDVRDHEALTAVVTDVLDRRGRLDGIVHGAGVLEDRFLRDKTRESFERVWTTKVGGALTLAQAAPDHLRFLVFFGSVAGVYGNRGQADYAAANDALDGLAWALGPRRAGRVLAVDWGPWAGAAGVSQGMVSDELAREYERRGIGLIDPDDGIECLLTELASGSTDIHQVVVARAAAGAFDHPTAGVPGRPDPRHA